jgi:beta-lactamase superfamily II metal-dependent hydrolase
VRLRIFDVAHGFCAYLIADTGNVMLFDCGYNEDRDFSPYKYLYGETRCSGIEQLVISHYDEDHIADLPNLRKEPIKSLLRNDSLNASEIRQLKLQRGPVSDAVESLLDMIGKYTGSLPTPIDYGVITASVYRNVYPTFTDPNNLSLVYFLHYRDVHVAFTGDLMTSGWQALLKSQSFRTELGRTKVFIASHHGRSSGYCAEVFNYCQPYVVVVSDAKPEERDESQVYAQHAIGIDWDGGRKKVLRTWDVGDITINQDLTGRWTITATK